MEQVWLRRSDEIEQNSGDWGSTGDKWGAEEVRMLVGERKRQDGERLWQWGKWRERGCDKTGRGKLVR